MLIARLDHRVYFDYVAAQIRILEAVMDSPVLSVYIELHGN
jgi:hypothetical protein